MGRNRTIDARIFNLQLGLPVLAAIAGPLLEVLELNFGSIPRASLSLSH